MVICVRGRECGFPRFRVTWRERDSLARSQARTHHPHPKRKGRGAGPRKRPRGLGPRVLENNRSPEAETGGSVRRHSEAQSPALRAARGEGAAVRSRPHPPRRRPVQQASWTHRAPAPPCGRVLAGCGTAPPGGAGLPISPSEPGCPLLPFLKPSSPQTSAEHHGIYADASRRPPFGAPRPACKSFDPCLAPLPNVCWFSVPAWRPAFHSLDHLSVLWHQRQSAPRCCPGIGLPQFSGCLNFALSKPKCKHSPPKELEDYHLDQKIEDVSPDKLRADSPFLNGSFITSRSSEGKKDSGHA
ncbi:hypothetical protein NN561_018213 [Cricetulus griseus]